MLFNTLSYLLFLTMAFVLARAAPAKSHTSVLLLASLVFYGCWRVEYVAMIVASAFVDYWLALKIGPEPKPARRRFLLLCSLATNLGLLLYFKYAVFILSTFEPAGAFVGQPWRVAFDKVIVPLGISFYTFLSISYTVDVYRGNYSPVRSFPLYLTYVMFWPHMIAGPILRAHELMPQLLRPQAFKLDDVARAVKEILFGLLLKVAVADQLAPLVNQSFLSDPGGLSALDVWTMAFGFGMQIYCDFAGYSMIALGSARLIGVSFPENFNWPYLATSPREFWKRWHITLSSWIRDYLYLPLCGARVQDRSEGGLEIVEQTSVRLTVALFVTWFLMGLWHGANWTFVLWGLWHAGLIWLARTTVGWCALLPRAIRKAGGWAFTLAAVMLGWLFFRAQSVSAAWALVVRVIDWRAYTYLSLQDSFYQAVAAVFVGMMLLYAMQHWLERMAHPLPRQLAEVAIVAAAGFLVFIFLRPTSEFIYFQF